MINKKFANKKSQTEIMGIVIIVILFSIGLLFAIKYVVLKPQTDVKKSFLQAELSSNTLNAMLYTNVKECGTADMRDLFKDCGGLSPEIDCEPLGSPFNEGIPDSCYYLNQTITNILNQTLNVWRVAYLFTTNNNIGEPLASIGEITGNIECTLEQEGRPQEFQLPTSSGTLRILLKVC